MIDTPDSYRHLVKDDERWQALPLNEMAARQAQWLAYLGETASKWEMALSMLDKQRDT